MRSRLYLHHHRAPHFHGDAVLRRGAEARRPLCVEHERVVPGAPSESLLDPGVGHVAVLVDEHEDVDPALGVLRALREAGVRTPQDVAVVGFDDIPESEFFAPPLTTVRQDFEAVGKQGIALLLDLIEGRPPAASRIAIEPQLVVRASTFPNTTQSERAPL